MQTGSCSSSMTVQPTKPPASFANTQRRTIVSNTSFSKTAARREPETQPSQTRTAPCSLSSMLTISGCLKNSSANCKLSTQPTLTSFTATVSSSTNPAHRPAGPTFESSKEQPKAEKCSTFCCFKTALRFNQSH